MSDVKSPKSPAYPPDTESSGFVRGLGLFDSTMIVVGSMIGSGIFIVSADIARNTGSTGGLLAAWIITGLLTVAAALSYGELAAMMPKAGGQYVYLREAYSPLWGFLYGWTLFLVIQTGTIAAVAVGFARYPGRCLAGDFSEHLDHSSHRALREICHQPFRAATGRAAPDSFPHASQHARIEARETDSERIHIGEDAGAGRADPGRSVSWDGMPRRFTPISAAFGRFTIRRRSSRARTG